MKFTRKYRVRFKDCDQAGIVFFPRYMEAFNDLIEDWFAELGWSFPEMVVGKKGGILVAKIVSNFMEPSQMGDLLRQELEVMRIGRSSCEIKTVWIKEDTDRTLNEVISVEAVVVFIDLKSKKSKPWDPSLRLKISNFLVKQ